MGGWQPQYTDVDPSQERLAETVIKLEREVYRTKRPRQLARRDLFLRIGEPIDVSRYVPDYLRDATGGPSRYRGTTPGQDPGPPATRDPRRGGRRGTPARDPARPASTACSPRDRRSASVTTSGQTRMDRLSRIVNGRPRLRYTGHSDGRTAGCGTVSIGGGAAPSGEALREQRDRGGDGW